MTVQKNKKITNKKPVRQVGCLNTLNDLLEGCQIIDYDWRYLYLNVAAAQQGHREPEELLHHTMMEMYPGIETTELFTVLRDCMDNRVVRQMVNNFNYPDGSDSWFELSIQPVPEGIFILSVDITERKRAENKVIQLARLYATLSQVNQIIVRVKERDELYQSICNLAVEFGKFDLAWIGLLDEETGDVNPFTANGLEVKQWPFPIVNVNQAPFKNGLVALAIRTSQVIISNDVQVDERTGPFQEQLLDYAYHGSAAIPFQLKGKTIGVLNLVSSQRGIFEDEREFNLLSEMSLDISFALASIQTEYESSIAQEQLLESERRFHSVFENATIGIYRTTPDGRILMANPALLQMMGYASFEELSQRKLLEDGFQSGYERDKFQSKIAENGEVRGFESGWTKKDGTPFFGRESAKAIKDASGNVLYYEGTVEDITDRKQAELALQASEENYRRLVENSESAIAVLDQDGQILYANSWAIKVWNDPEIVGRSVFDIYPEEYARPYLKAIRKVIHTQTAIVDEVESLVKEHIMWFRISMTPLKSPAGIVDRVLLNAWDITDSKQTEEAISRLAKFPSENPNPVVRLDKSGLILYANLASSPLLNKWEREVEQQVPEDWQEQIATVLQSGHLLETEMVCEERIFSLTVAPITDKGYVNIYAKDITERKQAEEELLFRNVLLSTQQEASLDGILVVDENARIISYNRRFIELWDVPKEFVEGGDDQPVLEFVTSRVQDPGSFLQRVQHLYEHTHETSQDEISAKDGRVIERYSAPMFGPNERYFGRIWYFRDITDRKRAEFELRASEEKYRSLIESTNSVITTIDYDGNFHFANRIASLELGCEPADILGKNMKELFPQEIAERQLAHVRQVIKSGEAMVSEAPNLLLGQKRWYLSNIQPVRDSTGRVRLALINSQDITERKQAEEKLLENERMLNLFVDYAPAAIAMFDRDLKYLAASRRYIIDYRLPDEDIVGRSHYEIFPEIPERWKEIHRRCLAGATEKADEDPFPRADGTMDWVRWEIQPWYTASKEIGGILLFSEVITAQKIAEKAIFESERQMRALVTSLDDLVFEIDEQGNYLNVWTGDESLLAQPRTKLLGANVVDFLGEENGRIFKAAMQRSLENGDSEIVEYPLIVIGGQRWFQARMNPILSQEPSRRTISVLIRDITERKAADVRLHLQLQRMNALSEIDRAIASGQDMRMALDVLLAQALSQLEVDAAIVLLFSSYDQMLIYKLGKGFRTSVSRESRIRLGEGLAGRVGLERKLLHIPDLVEAGESFTRTQLFKGEGFKVYFGVPLIAKGMLKGVLEIYHRDSLEPDLEWFNYLETLGGQAAIAIDNAQLFEGMQQSNLELVTAYDATIEGWSQAMDLRDKETEGHSQRVTELTMKLAKKMGIKTQELVNIRRGALLHDIGKLGVPDHILFKPDALNEAEWESMRQHPTYAYNMLMPIKYLNNALDIPYCHHEKWDGTGYPRGLKGEQIPLASRIFAVVDVWDALRSDRPYRPGWTSQEARQYILDQSGKHFDPKIVEIFIRMLEDG